MDCRFHFSRAVTSRIVLGAGIEPQLPDAVAELEPDGIVLIHDAALTGLADRLAAALRAHKTLAVPGDTCKQLDTVSRLAQELGDAGATRGTVIVGLGGGTVTDLVGFVAATYMRGVPCVLCPTTTLALCDAALGGKNGVDHGGLKNRLGTIRQPELIFADTHWLQSLPDELVREGLVEVVKKAAVLDAGHFVRLEQLAPRLVAREESALTEAIEMAVAMKMEVVLTDEREGRRRHWLNYGHTIGHAIESLAQGTLRHGNCVAMGLLAECRAAAGAVPAAVLQRIEALLHALAIGTTIPPALRDPTRLWQLARQDKKARAGNVPMVVPVAIGKGMLVELTESGLARALA
ncbi:MAG TPA: 3-dehydroquinate synthase family protein [Planctomycetota bacterium]|nr:3-dehydroquinate synthase family protein [Planctomycetota bacterium]